MTSQVHDAEGVDPREFVRPIWIRKWLILVIVVAATALAYVLSERKPNEYTASTRLFLQAAEPADPTGSQPLQQDDRGTQNQASLLQTRAVATDVAKRLHFTGDPGNLLASVTVTPETGSDFVAISARRGTPQEAAAVANGFAQAFITLRAADQRARIRRAQKLAARELAKIPRRVSTQGARSTLESKIRRYDVMATLPTGSAQQVDRALPPSVRSAPQPRRDALFAFAVSLVFAILAAFGLERSDRRLKHLAQVSPAYGAPLAAALPRASRGELKRGQQELTMAEPFREVVRGLRTNLQLATLDSPIRTLLVTSAAAGEGKSTLVRELALAYNEAGLRVAVIECDLRRPTIARLMQVDPEPGLTQVLLDECGLADAVQHARVEVSSDQHVAVAVGSGVSGNGRVNAAETLSVLTGGGQIANPPTVLGAQRMRRLLETSREHNDIVIIDSSPLLGVADTFPLLALVDGTLLVARLGVATRASARRAREIIDRIPGAEVLGVVANDVPKADLTDVGYGSGYDGRGDAPANRTA